MLLEMIVSSILPAAVDSAKQWVVTKLGGVKATTVDEQIKLDMNEIEKLKAVASLDQPGGTPSQWVIDLRASSRYILAGIVVVCSFSTLFVPVPNEMRQMAMEAGSIVFGFLFGSRLISNIRK